MKYFAYGSNMSLTRLQQRVPSAKRLDTVTLQGHQLRFHMSGYDGSGKCDAYQTNDKNHKVIGALFEIDIKEKDVLDKAESINVGYGEKFVSVQSDSGETFEALIYYALKLDHTLKPYSWYLNHVIVGARETNLPAEYLEIIEATESIEDLNKARDKKEREMHRQYGKSNADG